MLRSKINIILLIVFILTLACGIPGISTVDNNAVSTNAAETVIAGLTQNVVDTSTATTIPTATMTYTPTLIYPTLRATLTYTPTLVLSDTPAVGAASAEPSVTLTLAAIEMTVSRPTNCRTGPGKSYEIVGTLLTDEKAVVYGRDPSNDYWYIRNPDPGPEYCWVWGEYATFSGPQLSLPMLTPPATPTSTPTLIPNLSYKIKGGGMASCSGAWWVNMTITSESTYTFKSIKIEMQDITKNVFRALAQNGFTSSTGCNNLTYVESIPKEGSAMVSSPRFDYNLRDSTLRATITICTENDQQGICTSKQASFKP